MVLNLIVRTFNNLVFVHLSDTVKTEGVTARQGDRLFVVVVVRLEADTALKDRVNLVSYTHRFV